MSYLAIMDNVQEEVCLPRRVCREDTGMGKGHALQSTEEKRIPS